MAHKHYKNSPIIEAVCVVEFEEKSTRSVLDFYNKVSAAFPIKEEIEVYQSLKIEGSTEPSFKKSMNLRLWSEDKKRLLQVAPDFFVFNKLSPYPGWQGFFPEVENLLNEYYLSLEPSKIKKILLNYTNKFDLPINIAELKDYFNLDYKLTIETEDNFKNTMFGVRYNPSVNDEIKIQIFMSIDKDMLQVILDLEIYSLTCDLNDLTSIRKWLTTNHDIIYDYFEKIITEKTKEMID